MESRFCGAKKMAEVNKAGRIYDPVYGYVELSETEFKLVTSPLFQRLHWIKQLGPLHTVFPSAQHSRFSHTIGVFYIVKKMIEHLKKVRPHKYGYKFDSKEDQILRFAALLHDIGHVPLSHVGEKVLKDSAKRRHQSEDKAVELEDEDKLTWWGLFPEPEYKGGSTKLHERLSAHIVLRSRKIDELLRDVWPQKKRREQAKKRIARIIVGQDSTDIPTLLLHSELDADRLDYLLRDSFFTGVGYGKIELDYIISRLRVLPGSELIGRRLCVEGKGLHTVEHYILGRFFLQTLIIYNRKVRFMDLLFEDVMTYMVEGKAPDGCELMNLTQFRDCIEGCKGEDRREHLHRLYSYTDAEVYMKMRRLHEELDEKQSRTTASEEELYINDCIKTIMDGEVPEPVFHTCQKVVDLGRVEDRTAMLEKEAEDVAKDVARKLGVWRKRVKTNVVRQEVMKYRPDEEDANREAVTIMFKKPGESDKCIYAAESNATLLKDLSNKALLLFNVYYVRCKAESEAEVDTIEGAIREAFNGIVNKAFYADGTEPEERTHQSGTVGGS
ncbi:MAG: HD domain-containing protein [Phycisphaerales bacterium]|nr:MAG: HD domain-containing protein [Phycisphaerales bacterium]